MIREHHTYKLHAEAAAEAERNGDYKEAVTDWRVAAAYARNGVNRHWAEARCAFCSHHKPVSAAEPDKEAA